MELGIWMIKIIIKDLLFQYNKLASVLQFDSFVQIVYHVLRSLQYLLIQTEISSSWVAVYSGKKDVQSFL
jgi:hypothetical protein